MRMKQPKGEKKIWEKKFLALVQETYPDYVRNTKCRGIKTELLREVDGIFYQQTSYCYRGNYRHCFSLSVTTSESFLMDSPFRAGGRFDSNYTISKAFFEDLKMPARGPSRIKGLHDSHKLRIGYEDIVRACTKNAEIYLAPYYRKNLIKAAPTLIKCMNIVEQNPDILEDQDYLLKYKGKLKYLPVTAIFIAHPPLKLRLMGYYPLILVGV